MSAMRTAAAALMLLLSLPAARFLAANPAWDEAKVISEATSGLFHSSKGKYFDVSLNDSLDFDAQVVDLNGDGRPEVFTQIYGSYLGGATGVQMNLYIKRQRGSWQPQFGFPGVYNVLKTRHRGYPDIEIGGPGFCFPVWRWSGLKYAPYKGCDH